MRSTLRASAFRTSRTRTLIGPVVVGVLVALVLLAPQLADANPDHYAGDYFMFAKAAGDGTSTDPKTFEPDCTNGSNDKQAEVSGSTSFFYGRIHSNADWANSGATNTFVDTGSPNPELTYGVNDNAPPPSQPDCTLQANAGSYNSGGLPVNIIANGNAASVEGPYQIGEHGWPGNLGEFLNDSDGVTFGNDVTQVLPGASCAPGTSLTGTTTYTITAADNGKVICNGTGLIKFGQQGLGTIATPFRITMISHGPIEIQDSNLVLAPVSHGVLAWTDLRFSVNATAIKLAGQGINVVERAILFTPRSGQDVSGSQQATLCLQMVGQGALKAAGSSSHFGPLAPGCGVPADVVTEIHADRSATGGSAHDNLGAGASAVKVGTPIHDKVIVSSETVPASNLNGPITARRFNSGDCTGTAAATAVYKPSPGAGELPYTPATTVTLDDVLAFTPGIGIYSYRASYGGDNNSPPNMANAGSCEGPVRVVDARISIAQSGTNRAGSAHTFTVTVEKNDGTGWTAAAGVVVAATESGVGDITSQTCSAGTTAAGTCTVTVNSAAPGSSTVNASGTVSVAGVSIDVSTAGYGAHTLSNVKTWVDARISIGTSETNRVDDAHTFTVTVEKNDGGGWVAAGGVTVSPTSSGAGGITGGTCNSGSTSAAGTCTVIVNSATPGATTVHATATVSVGGLDLPVDTAGVGAHNLSNVKTWVDARISIAQSGTNRVGSPHTFTVTVEKNDGTGWAAAPGVTVTPSAGGAGGISGGTCNLPTNASGQCTVIVDSDQPGTTTVNATATVSVGGLDLPVDTAGVGAGTISNIKTWVDARISIAQTGTNRAGEAHTFTVTVEKNDGTGWSAAAGVAVVATKSGAGSITSQTCDNPGTNASGECTVTVNSTAPGIATVHAGATVPVGGLDLPVNTDGGPGASSVSNVKTWVDARISIAQSGINRVGDAHTFTVKVEKNDGSGSGWLPGAGVNVTPSAAGVGGITGGTCGNQPTNADGECTVVINSTTPGTTTVDAAATVSVGGKNLPVDTDGVGAGTISNVKTWVDARISIKDDGTNRAGEPHIFTVLVELHDGSPAGWQPAAGVVITPSETGVGDITGETCTAGTLADGTCTVTVNSSEPGKSEVHAKGTVLVFPLFLDVDTEGKGAYEVENDKTWVDARISITESGTNAINQPHAFTVLVELHDGSQAGWQAAPGIVVTASESGVGNITSQTCDAPGTGVDGTCTVTVNSSSAGESTVHALATVPVGGLDLQVNTDGGPGAFNVSNVKTWANARITIQQSGVNKVGDPHTFTVTVQRDLGAGWVGVPGLKVTVDESGVGSISTDTCTSPGTDANGQCTVTVISSAPGVSTVDAAASVPIDSSGKKIDVSTTGSGAHDVSNVKTWVDARISIVESGTNAVGDPHTFTVTVEQHNGTGWGPAAGVVVSATEVGAGDITGETCSGGTTAEGMCTVTVNSAVAGTSTVNASATVTVSDVQIAVATNGYGAHGISNVKTWVDQGNTLLIIDEDSLDNGIHFNQTGGPIIPGGPSFFGKLDVNDDRSSHTQRDVLRYFQSHVGDTITVRTGQTGDEGWFAPNCIPQKWVSGTASTCLPAGAGRDTAIDNYFGLNGSAAVPLQSKLDKIPAVMPLRARGLVSLIGKTVCAVVYDSDISINYTGSTFPFTDGNLQGETLGIVAFQVNEVRKLNRFSSSTLPEVQLTIRNTSSCGTWTLFNAPVPRSSSVPNDIDPLNLAGVASNGYRALAAQPTLPLFF